MSLPKLPAHALAQLVGPYAELTLPWNSAQWLVESFEGMTFGGCYFFRRNRSPQGEPGSTPPATEAGPNIVLWTSDADIDADGPGGSLAIDPCWQGATSLRYPDHTSCDSRKFPGIVVPPGIERQFGVRLGDYGIVFHGGNAVAVQVYDVGPTRKIGEMSSYCGRMTGLVPTSESDHAAATRGNNFTDVVYLIFAGSGPGHAVDRHCIADAVEQLAGPSLHEKEAA